MLQAIKKFYHQKVTLKNLTSFLCGLLALVCLAWLGDQSYFYITRFTLGKPHPDWDSVAWWVALFGVCLGSLLTAYLSFNFVKVRHLQSSSAKGTYKALLLTTSPADARDNQWQIVKHQGVFKLFQVDPKTKQTVEKFPFSGYLTDDIALFTEKKVRCSWQQVLRALRNHKNNVEQIYLVVTEEMHKLKYHCGDQTQSEAQCLRDWIAFYFNDALQETQVSLHRRPVSANEMQDYYHAFDELIDTLTGTYQDKEILIDITGGRVPASLGGCLATLHNNCRMQYIDAIAQPSKVHIYDATIKQID
ncbi:hypothetical protein [Pseudoalteromonas rubra]|uniref:Uncharacterized protein n=1 Tax=Pseudoalteromonas rubra TaxID=43658 RepID=A0A0F4QU45_9GAMM|nr:hypothetical protein [Pseudoalteromonas rubra]KJZ10884.1 hypothetical protein TW77_06710 [Pseudoalteromonas rubra]